MRLWLVLVLGLLVGCNVPHSTGALWALEAEAGERELFRTTEAQRSAATQNVQVDLADRLLAQERTRMEIAVGTCPGSERAPLRVSPGDKVRDTIRMQAAGDVQRLAEVAHLALADWYLRHGVASGSMQLCDQAHSALAGQLPLHPPNRGILSTLPSATVTRRTTAQGAINTQAPLPALADYALGVVDTLHAAAPLPQYLAAVYGGNLIVDTPTPLAGSGSPEELVDQIAPGYPDWEPDALWAVLDYPLIVSLSKHERHTPE
jgi:hypothetical protein